MKNKLKNIGTLAFLLSIYTGFGQTNLEVNIDKSVTKIQPTMYGIFFEDINFAADGGLYAEMVKNRSFEFDEPKMGWVEPNSNRHSFNNNSGIARIFKYTDSSSSNHNFARITVKDEQGYELINEGYRGMGVKEGGNYRISLMVAQGNGNITALKFQMIGENAEIIGETRITPATSESEWKTYESVFQASKTDEKAKLKISFEGSGEIDLDMISLFPEDTWKNRKNGLRKDLVQLLDDLDPGFLRFPGGCIVEGRTLAKRYQWKKTVGPPQDREILVNRWNTEFRHKFTPDYFQSFGLGFFEYFQLSEDMGAEPLPILSCGIACQYNTGELVSMDDLDPYVQDALDLIEFANGSVATPWGKVRRDMGHPVPFNMKYIGIGNEQWGPEFIERYKVFQERIREVYPDIIIVSGSGPSPDGDYFEYGWEELSKLDTDLIDEHYYRSPEWFRENATRYDNYDRRGPKVFAGEYAAHPKAEDGPKENNWEAALSEAAFMTGLERNADVVHLTSYAPLMAHKDAWQWAPDLIWFDNLTAYGTPNYYVQKLFSTNSGTDLISVTKEGAALTGQEELYASAVKDSDKKEVIVKLVNTSGKPKEVKINFNGGDLSSKGILLTLKSEELASINSFDTPEEIRPEERAVKLKRGALNLELPAYSLSILKINSK